MADRKQASKVARKPTPAFSLTNAWALAFLALLVVLFFHEVVVGGKTLLSPDASSPAGFARIGARSLFQDHVYPLWNPFVFLGMPSFASGTYNPLIYPPDWPLALLQKVLPLPELTWMLIYYVLGGFFMYLLAREWKARPEGALLGAVAFVFAPNLVAVGSHGHGSQLVDSAYIPLLLWLAARWLRAGRISDLAWLALAGGFQLLRGHVQICFYTWLAVGLYTLVRVLADLRRPADLGPRAARAAGVALAAGLAFGLAGFYNLPLSDYARHSIRGGTGGGAGMVFATQWSLAPFELISVMVPGWMGFGGSSYWGGMPFTDYPNAYVGMVTVLLAIPAFLAGGPSRVFALVLAVTAILISFGRYFPLYGFLYDHLPLFSKFRVPVMVIVLFQVAAALGLAWGWSTVLEGAGKARDRRLTRVMTVVAVVAAAGLIAGLAGPDLWRASYVAWAERARSAAGQQYSPELAAFAYQGFIGDLMRVSLLGLAAAALGMLALRGKLPASVATLGVLALLMIELWPVSGRVMQPVIGDPVRRNLELGRDDVIDFLEKAGSPGTFRILPLQEFQNNRFAGFGIASLGGYHAAKPRLYQDFYETVLSRDLNLSWLRLLNVRYIVSRGALQPLPPYLREVHSGSAFVYENLVALPRATVVGRYRVIAPARAILDSVMAGTSESSEVTFLEQDPHLQLGPVTGARAEILSYGLNQVTVEVETPGPALLRLADLWYPYWTATVDDRDEPVLKADYLLRAVAVPAGRHRVVFRYQSPAIRRGLLLTGASLVVILLLFAVPPLVRRRVRPRSGEGPPTREGA